MTSSQILFVHHLHPTEMFLHSVPIRHVKWEGVRWRCVCVWEGVCGGCRCSVGGASRTHWCANKQFALPVENLSNKSKDPNSKPHKQQQLDLGNMQMNCRVILFEEAEGSGGKRNLTRCPLSFSPCFSWGVCPTPARLHAVWLSSGGSRCWWSCC